MWDSTTLTSVGAFVASGLLTRAARRFALARGVLDVPNARSSHERPTPRGGGIAIVLATVSALGVLAAVGVVKPDLLLALTGGGLAVASVGLIDDRHPLPAWVRLIVHIAAAIWALFWLGRGSDGVVLQVLNVLAIVWVLNLYNFMDGIDGIAASEGIFVSWGGGGLLLALGGGLGVAAAAFAFGAACGGFLIWNWPPAKIFMGDVGSGYLGYVIAVLALASSHVNPVSLWVWLILGGAFFVDATVTLIRRTLRGDRVYQAHRSHAYQWLARRWGSHKRVTLTVLALNVSWLLPCAWFAMAHPGVAVWTAVVALIPLVLAALLTGAGRAEVG